MFPKVNITCTTDGNLSMCCLTTRGVKLTAELHQYKVQDNTDKQQMLQFCCQEMSKDNCNNHTKTKILKFNKTAPSTSNTTSKPQSQRLTTSEGAHSGCRESLCFSGCVGAKLT